LLLLVVVGIGAFLVYVLVIEPGDFPLSYTLPDPPPLEVNDLLTEAERLHENVVHGPEQIVHHNGVLYTGTADGRIVRISNGKLKTVVILGDECGHHHHATTCSRPLGLAFDPEGFLLVCDPNIGLHRVNVQTGESKVILPASTELNGRKISFLNSVDVGQDGAIYLSDTAASSGHHHTFSETLMGARATGRLIRFDPVKKTSRVLLDGLAIANGVQLSPSEDFVLVAETMRARIMKFNLKGKNTGKAEVFAENLPCLPDNIGASSKGGYWVGSGFSRYQQKKFNCFDFLGPRAWIRRILAQFPLERLFPYSHEGSIVVELNAKGEVVRTLMDQEGKVVRQTSGVEDVKGVLYLGSYHEPYIAKIDARKL
jgi:sugar lactone lactonase YvrE